LSLQEQEQNFGKDMQKIDLIYPILITN